MPDDLNSTTYRRAARDSGDFEGYDYIDLKANEVAFKQMIDKQIEMSFPKQSTFKSNTDTQF